jgi:hypothetical protein
MDPKYREHAPEMAVVVYIFAAILALALAVVCLSFVWLCWIGKF